MKSNHKIIGTLLIVLTMLFVGVTNASATHRPTPHASTSSQDTNNPTDCTWQGSYMYWTHQVPQARQRGSVPPKEPVFCLRDTQSYPGHRLVWQYDGNLVLYWNSTTGTSCPIWSSHTYGVGATSLNFQSDGNIVIRNASGVALWNSKSADYPNGNMWSISVDEIYKVGENYWRNIRIEPNWNVIASFTGFSNCIVI